jgi:asparagine synthase (glutamine-hydrolysing)
MDSTSIVCMSDHARRLQNPHAELLDTVSFYDDSEPNWNERPYFSIIEAARGKTGIHIATSFMDRTFEPSNPSQGIHLLPGADGSTHGRESQFQSCVSGRGYRTILSGIGGDEVLGGVPTPLPELANYLVSANLPLLMEKTFSWCLVRRTSLIQMLFETVKFTTNLYQRSCVDNNRLPPWINSRLRDTCVELARSTARDGRRFGFSPSTISNGLAWWSIMETLPHLTPSSLVRYEYRYPYLDQDLVNFLFRIPREQLVRPGRRRSLMRRALGNIVPVEILERRRKAFLIRGPIASFQQSQGKIEALFADSRAVDYEFIDHKQLRKAMDLTVAAVDPKWWPALFRVINFELWLRGNCGIPLATLSDRTIQTVMLRGLRADKFHAG